MTNEKLRQKAIKASKSLLGELLTINTDADLTPKGKRYAKVVRSRRGKKLPSPVIAWYVGGRFFKHTFDVKLTNEWLSV